MSSMTPGGFPPGGLGVPPGGFGPAAQPGMPVGMPAGAAPSGRGSRRAPTRRVVSIRQGAAVLLALAAVGAFLFSGTDGEEPDGYVLRAAQSIPGLTQVESDMFTLDPIDSNWLEPDAVAAATLPELEARLEEIEGSIIATPVARGQQIRDVMFTGPTSQLSEIGEDERLVSVPASLANAVAGTLRAGDRVDLVVVERSEGLAGVVAYDLEVVAVHLDESQLSNLSGEQTGPDGRDIRPDQLQPYAPIPGMYTLRVPADLMPLIAAASSRGELHLFYRVPGETGEATELVPVVSLLERLCLDTALELRPLACSEQGFIEPDPFAEGLVEDELLLPELGAVED